MITINQIQERYAKNPYYPYNSEREYLDSYLVCNWKLEEQLNRKNYHFEILSGMSNADLMGMYWDTKIPDFKEEYLRRIRPHNKDDPIDWARLKRDNPIPETIQKLYGIQWNRRAIKCPFKDHQEKSASFSITKDGSYFHCFGCHRKGTVLDFITLYEDISLIEVAKKIS